MAVEKKVKMVKKTVKSEPKKKAVSKVVDKKINLVKNTSAAKTTSVKKGSVNKAAVKSGSVKKAASKKVRSSNPARKVTEKKTTASKSSSVKKVSYKYVQTPREKKLVKELTSILPNLDSEGLLFLIEQANVHIYNMQAIALQENLNEVEEKRARVKLSEKSKSKKNNFRIEKSNDGSVFHIICGGKWKLINADEMFTILKIVNSGLADDDIRLNLIHWFFNK